MSVKKQAAFLFGSGISFPSKMPSVYDISAAALTGAWHFHTDTNFYAGFHPGQSTLDPTTAAVQGFLGKVNECAADYLADLSRHSASRKPHYEDWFSLAAQAAQPEIDHVPNLAVVECLRRLRRDTAPFHCGFKGGSAGVAGFVGLARTACDYLHWVVHHQLAAGGRPRRGLDLISATANAVEAVDVFTLNHDLLVEDQLTSDGIPLEFGFDDRSHGEFFVYSGWPGDSRKKVRLFKLHGSLNWYFYEFPEWARQYAIPNGAPFHSKDEKGNRLYPLGGKAAFLSGTIVKEQSYGVGFWGNLFGHFQQHLSQHTHLICCGYGFADPGINQRLAQWSADRLDGKNRLVILTPEPPEKYFADKPLWLMQLYEERRVVLIPRYLETCSLDDLKPYFDPLA